MQFLCTFESEQNTELDSNKANDIELTLYTSISTIENINPDSETCQASAFINGYAAFSLLKKSAKVCALIVVQY